MTTTTTKCTACHRKALSGGSKYCLHHKQAFDSMINHYKAWVKAYGQISWEEFLTKLSSMQEAGRWIREVIEVELKK